MSNRIAIEKIIWGFGVRPDTLDPTILNISMSLYGDRPWHVLMYTLNSDTWTVLGNNRFPHLGNLIHYENRYICAWLLEVEAAVVISWRVLFVISSQNIAKLLGITMDDDPIVEVGSCQEMVHTLQVYDCPSQQFHNVDGNDAKKADVQAGGHGNILTTLEYVKKVNEDVSEDDNITEGPWLSAIVNLHEQGVIASGCLGDVDKFLKKGSLN
nr:hypothetical protein [Tanacetum cinerariifolium]